ncbi:MAG: NRDE family protein [Ectothiorhodospiraceae bacterium]|nr:NRDE family protein [Ectothiorhodospiraceae bacterium]MCH8506679.1 NRDE family protein [Ectothiorhodospiraceae bacterium]
MCLLAFALGVHPGYPLVVAGNRDEFHERPTTAMHWWKHPRLLAGVDRRAGGTWLGLSRGGRFATITNYRDPEQHRPTAPSRGGLVVRALTEPQAAIEAHLHRHGGDYNGFNLLWSRGQRMYYYCNQAGETVKELPPGVYGLSNGVLDTPWPKLVRVREGLEGLLGRRGELTTESLFELMADRWLPAESSLPDTGIGAEWESLLASPFIRHPHYGTRSTSVVLVRRNGISTVSERVFDPEGQAVGQRQFRFQIQD